jgi:hypothetical protein
MLDAPENKAIQDIWVLPPANPQLHVGRRIAVLATDGVEEIEVTTLLAIESAGRSGFGRWDVETAEWFSRENRRVR